MRRSSVVTAPKIVTPYASRMSRRAAGSGGFSCSSATAPFIHAPNRRQLPARVQPVSLVVQITSPGPMPSWRHGCIERTKTPRAACTTALGGPEEPEVKYISAGSSASMRATGVSRSGPLAAASKSIHPSAPPRATRTRRSEARPPKRPAKRRSQIAPAAPLRSTRCATSSAVTWVTQGTGMAPRCRQAVIATCQSGVRSMKSSTRSPLTNPAAASEDAKRRVRSAMRAHVHASTLPSARIASVATASGVSRARR